MIRSSLRIKGVLILTVLMMVFLIACGSGDDDGGNENGSGNTESAVGTGTISGSVSGTTIIAVDDSGGIIAIDDTTSKAVDVNGNYPFSLTEIPLNVNIKIYLLTGGGVYPMYFDDSGTDANVFSLTSAIDINLGFVDTAVAGQEGKAIPQNNPVNTLWVNPEGEDSVIPPISGATINNFAGTWLGSVPYLMEDGEAGTSTVILDLSISGNLLVGTWYISMDGSTVNIIGTVNNGIFTSDLPTDDPSNPDCANWDVSVTAILDASLTTMNLNGSGTFCGDGGGKLGAFSGLLNKSVS